MLKEKWSKIAWSIIILCFVILFFVGQGKIKEQNSVLNNVPLKADTQNYEKQSDIEENLKFEGYVSSIGEKSIIVKNSENVEKEILVENLMNARTREKIEITQIAIGDYYKNAEIMRNLSGELLRKELILSMARAFHSLKLAAEFTRLKQMKVYEGYSTFKVHFYDKNYELFGKDHPELFVIELKADENTVLYARTNVVTIYNLQKQVRTEALQEKKFYIEIDENTINDERPLVTSFEIAE